MTNMERLCPKGFLFQERPFYVFFCFAFFVFVFFFTFGKKKCLEIGKFAKFENDLLKTNEDIARPQRREILQTFLWWGSATFLVPPPPPPPPPTPPPPPPPPDTHPITYNRQQIFATLRSYILAHLRRNNFKFGNFTATEMKIILRFIN